MSTASNASIDPTSAAIDDLDAYVAERAEHDADFRHAAEDVADLNHVIDELVAMRKRIGISQKRLAQALGVRQPTVSQFENESSDPRLSTLQRYARALGVRLHLGLESDAEASWTPRCVRYKPVDAQRSPIVAISLTDSRPTHEVIMGVAAWDKKVEAADNSRRDFALGA